MRSLTLDVKVWDEAVLGMMERIGNDVANEAWEAELYNDSVKWVYDLPLPCHALPGFFPCPALYCSALPYALTNTYSVIHIHDTSSAKSVESAIV